MENPTRFDLNAAVENWRHELAAQPSLAADDRRELETHLRDALAELKTCGLSDEESFWLARRRVGQPQKLAEEFVKADPAKVWRERMFWMVLCFFAIRLWSSLTSSVLYAFFTNLNFTIHNRLEDILPQWVLFYFPHWLRDLHYVQFISNLLEAINLLLAVAIVLFVVRGKMEKTGSVWAFAFASQLRFALLAMLLVVFDYVICNQLYNLLADKKNSVIYTANFSFNALWLLGLVAIATWLIPSQNNKNPNTLEFMENQTRFDLNAAVESWRHELAAQPPLAPDDRRELETHLSDALAELRTRGLNDEEFFWLARRRVGQPQKLAEEFVKADPAKVWRDRLYWMAVALVGSYVFMTWKDLVATWLNQNNYNWVESLYLIPVLFLIGSVVVIRRGKIPAFLNHFESTSPFSWQPAATMFLILLATISSAYVRGRNLPSGGDGMGGMITVGYNIGLVLSWFGNAWPPATLVLILLFTAKRKTKTSRIV